MAVCDVPSILYWEQIQEAFPSAKIILTVRDPEDWFRSINTTLTPLSIMVHRWSWMLRLLCLVFFQRTSQIDMLRLLLDQFMRKELLEEQTATRYEIYDNRYIRNIF